MPQACTRMRTCPAVGLGISRSTISKSAPAFGTSATFIFAIETLRSSFWIQAQNLDARRARTGTHIDSSPCKQRLIVERRFCGAKRFLGISLQILRFVFAPFSTGISQTLRTLKAPDLRLGVSPQFPYFC